MTSRSIREALQVQLLDTQKMLKMVENHPVMGPSLKQIVLELQSKIDLIPIDQKEAKVVLLFSGKPVLGSLGIDAFFIGKVLSPFQNMVETDFAQRNKGKVAGRGPAKKYKESQLFITALPRGSFGIELTKLQNQNLFDEVQLSETLVHLTNLIDASAKSDEDFAVAIDNTSARTITSLQEFLGVISNEDAGITIESGGIRCELTQEAARIAFNRVSTTKTDEVPINFDGTLRGATLDSWRFDFTSIEGDKISGRISDELSEDEVKLYLTNYLDTICTATFELSTIVFKNGRMKKTYQLVDIKSMPNK